MLNQTELQTPENWQPPKGKMLNPCVDAVFKAIFTSNNEKSKKALTSFLSAVLDKKISDVTVEPNELPVETFGQKQSRFDIVCMVDDVEPANIEIQTCDSESFFSKRIEYHSAHLLNHYVEKGSSWYNVPVTYQISIVNFIFDKSTDKYVSRYKMRTDDGRLLESRQNIIVVELPKIAKLEKTSVNDLTSMEKWCKFLLDADDSEKSGYVKGIASSEEGIMSAQDMLWDLNKSYSMWTAEEAYNNEIRWREMEKRENVRKLEKSLREGHEKGMNEGLQKGLKEGREQGIQQGLAQGITQGEHNARIETARAFLKLGVVTVEQIAQATGLPLAEVQSLAN